MSLEHVILGILEIQPMTGYELKTQAFDKSVAHFWPADKAQIYRTLDKMTEAGWVETRLEIQTDRPNRKIFSLTPAGQAELKRWLSLNHEIPIYRDPFLVQLFFADKLPDEVIRQVVDAQIEAHQAILDSYADIPVPPIEELNGNRAMSFRRFTLDFGIMTEKAILDWLRQVRQTIEKLEPPK